MNSSTSAHRSPRPIRIEPTYHEKIWGRPRGQMRLGEIWFRAHPLLLKFIFTSEKLSVQVHPGDSYALKHEQSAGKTECWYIIDAEPGARLAVGLRRPMSRQEILASVESQTIEQELNWLEMRAGDFVFVPWGTVHAIGPGLTLCEVQQFSDITYRLYDYGRPRELHLDKALDVIRNHPAAGRLRPACYESDGVARHCLAVCRHFALERISTAAEFRGAFDPGRTEVLAFTRGEGEIESGGERQPFAPEQMWQLPATVGSYRILPRSETTWLRAWAPEDCAEVGRELAEAGVPENDRKRVVIEDV